MIQQAYVNRFSWLYTNHTAPQTANIGTSVTPGASNAEGTYTQIASSANIANEVWAFAFWIAGGNTAAQDKSQIMDVGVDEAGGTSYTAIISNLVMGNSAPANAGGLWFYFPMKIQSGSSVAVRIQGSNATAGTVRVGAYFWGRPSRPELFWRGQVSETIGTITNSGGVSFTPGNATEGSWFSLGTTTRKLSYWQLGMQISNGTVASQATLVDLAFGDGTNKHMIMENVPLMITSTSESQVTCPLQWVPTSCFCPVPAGGELWVRGHCSTTPASGYNAVAVGIG